MKMLTLKLKPTTLFGIALALTGVVVIALSFVSNKLPEGKNVSKPISASTDEDRREYLESYGWELAAEYEEKELTIPEKWNKVYSDYNKIQQSQGFDLTDYKGKSVRLFTYEITNYEDESVGIVADMLVCDGVLIGGDICNTSAENGFLVGFNGE
ncbi:MAG: DUF4830 domain-containing protein [Eubacterium sp.]|nr:DUF4830 domain-containing protein [Eubacterium sp.]